MVRNIKYIHDVKEQNVTIEKLATMVANGFEKTATRADLQSFRDEMETRFDGIDERLDRIENILIAGHDRRIEKMVAF